MTIKNDVDRFSQQDWLATSIRTTLALAGPLGAIVAEFLTQFVPEQRIDRLHQYVEQLGERLSGLEEEFRERIRTSAGYASLAEQASLAAVQTASAERRRDLAELLRTGLSKNDAELVEHEALLRLLGRLNDAQVLILHRHGAFKDAPFNDPGYDAFTAAHPRVFGALPPSFNGAEDDRKRWTMFRHYEDELTSLGLLKDPEGPVKSSTIPVRVITHLGELLLTAIGRDRA